MKIKFLGAVSGMVTGSATLIETGNEKILVDAGIAQGSDVNLLKDEDFSAESIDILILTHAHTDHSGNIPLLIEKGFKGKIYSTKETKEITEILLLDSYSEEERNAQSILESLKRFVFVPYNTFFRISEGLEIKLYDAGHLLGSASVLIIAKDKKILFSGDIGNTNTPLINDPEYPEEADFVVMEATYGSKSRINKQKIQGKELFERAKILAEITDDTFKKGGNLIIPVFSIGRSQEILYLFRMIYTHSLLPYDVNVYLDSPLAAKATALYVKCLRSDYLDEEAKDLVEKGVNPIIFPSFRAVETVNESKSLNDKDKIVILASSGMCEGGRIRHHLKHNLPRGESTVLFTGYQSKGTLGFKIYIEKRKKVTIFNEKIDVKARILFLEGTSGHADKEGLLRWAESVKKVKLFALNHAESVERECFAKTLKETLSVDVILPNIKDEVEI